MFAQRLKFRLPQRRHHLRDIVAQRIDEADGLEITGVMGSLTVGVFRLIRLGLGR